MLRCRVKTHFYAARLHVDSMTRVNVGALLSASVDLAARASWLIRAIIGSGIDLHITDKAGGGGGRAAVESEASDPQTFADISAQALIVGSLRQVFGAELRVVGEEGAGVEDGRPELWCGADVQTDLVARVLQRNAPGACPPPSPSSSPPAVNWRADDDDAQLVELRDLCVFVDPLDGTKEFTQGLHDAVTVLVGLTLRGRPLGGVVAQPWGGAGGGSRCVWGAVGLGVFEGEWNKESKEEAAVAAAAASGSATPAPCPAPLLGWKRLSPPPIPPVPARGRVIGTTRSHARPDLELALQRCGATADVTAASAAVVRVGGAGNKVLKLIDGEIDCWLYPCAGTKRWDTAAGEALLLELGGRLTDRHGALYTYDFDRDAESPTLRNAEGVIATLGDAHQLYVDACAAPATASILPSSI